MKSSINFTQNRAAGLRGSLHSAPRLRVDWKAQGPAPSLIDTHPVCVARPVSWGMAAMYTLDWSAPAAVQAAVRNQATLPSAIPSFRPRRRWLWPQHATARFMRSALAARVERRDEQPAASEDRAPAVAEPIAAAKLSYTTPASPAKPEKIGRSPLGLRCSQPSRRDAPQHTASMLVLADYKAL